MICELEVWEAPRRQGGSPSISRHWHPWHATRRLLRAFRSFPAPGRWLGTAALACLLLAPSTASVAKPALEWSGQLARVEQIRATDGGVDWQIGVLDLCAHEAKGVPLELPCTGWRPLTDRDSARVPEVKGKVTLPDGRSATLGRRTGEPREGEVHRVSVRLDGDEPGEAWPLTPVSGSPGTWRLDPAPLGDRLAAGVNAEVWTLAVTGDIEGRPLRWIDAEAAEVAPAEIATADESMTRPLALDPTSPVSQAWICAAIGRWTAAGRFAPRPDGEPLEPGMALVEIEAALTRTGDSCVDIADEAVGETCELTRRVVESIRAAATESEWAEGAATAARLASICPVARVTGLREAAGDTTDELLAAGEHSRLRRYLELNEVWLDAEEVEDARTRSETAIDATASHLLEAEDWRAALEFIASETVAMGTEWATATRDRAEAIRDQEVAASVAARLAAIEAAPSAVLRTPVTDRELSWDLATALADRVYALVLAVDRGEYRAGWQARSLRERWDDNRLEMAISVQNNTELTSARRAAELVHTDALLDRDVHRRLSIQERYNRPIAHLGFQTASVPFAWEEGAWRIDRFDDLQLFGDIKAEAESRRRAREHGMELSDPLFMSLDEVEWILIGDEEKALNRASRDISGCPDVWSAFTDTLDEGRATLEDGLEPVWDPWRQGILYPEMEQLVFTAGDFLLSTFDHAVAHCAALDVDGVQGWTVPTECYLSGKMDHPNWCVGPDGEGWLAYRRWEYGATGIEWTGYGPEPRIDPSAFGAGPAEQSNVPPGRREVICELRNPSAQAIFAAARAAGEAATEECEAKIDAAGHR